MRSFPLPFLKLPLVFQNLYLVGYLVLELIDFKVKGIVLSQKGIIFGSKRVQHLLKMSPQIYNSGQEYVIAHPCLRTFLFDQQTLLPISLKLFILGLLQRLTVFKDFFYSLLAAELANFYCLDERQAFLLTYQGIDFIHLLMQFCDVQGFQPQVIMLHEILHGTGWRFIRSQAHTVNSLYYTQQCQISQNLQLTSIIMNKTKINEPFKATNETTKRRPRRCTKCSCVFSYDKYPEHFAACVRPEVRMAQFSRNKARSTMNSVLNRNNIRAPDNAEKKQQKKSLIPEEQARFRIKNVSTYSQKEKPTQQSNKNIYTEKRQSQKPKGETAEIKRQIFQTQRKRQTQQKRQTNAERQRRQMVNEQPVVVREVNNRSQIINDIQNYEGIAENNPIFEEQVPQRNVRNQQSLHQHRRESLVQAHNQPAQSNQPFDINALIYNSNSIISFIRNINLRGQDPTMDSMLAQLEQLNTIANQIAQMSSIGNRIGYSVGNLFAARIHQLQTVITNQIGIALIRGFNERLGSQFELLMFSRPAAEKAGFGQQQIEELFAQKMSYSLKECSICLQDIKKYDLTLQLQCNHTYHPACIKEWLLSSKKCPMCRKVQQG